MLKEKENNMSTLTGQKSDGSPISFNFKLENGLPYKPMIEPEHQYFYSHDSTNIVCIIKLTTNELKDIGELKNGLNIIMDKEDFRFFIDVNDKYIVISNSPLEVIQARLKGKLIFEFHHEKEFLTGYKTEAIQ
jgi:hypothetical protein